MKTIILKHDDINLFVDEICAEVEQGNVVEISMYGYKAYAYPTGSKENIRLAVLRKLKAIKRKEENLHLLRTYYSLSEEQIKNIASVQSPDEIEDICFEYNVYPSQFHKHNF